MKNSVLVLMLLGVASCKEQGIPGLLPPGPVANFNFEMGREGQVSFTSTSTNAGTFQWTFGDGTSSAEENPRHTFAENATFVVTLKAIGPGGAAITSKSVTLHDVGLLGAWMQEGREYTDCDDPGQNSSFTPCPICSTWNFSLTGIAITTTGFPDVNLSYTLSGNNIDLGATTHTSTFEIVGDTLYITLHHNSTSSFPGCEDKMQFSRL